MPRFTQDRLLGYQFQVVVEHVPKADERGNVIHNGNGEPKTEEMRTLVLQDPATGHQVAVPLSLDARDELVRQLTGGLIVPTGGSL